MEPNEFARGFAQAMCKTPIQADNDNALLRLALEMRQHISNSRRSDRRPPTRPSDRKEAYRRPSLRTEELDHRGIITHADFEGREDSVMESLEAQGSDFLSMRARMSGDRHPLEQHQKYHHGATQGGRRHHHSEVGAPARAGQHK